MIETLLAYLPLLALTIVLEAGVAWIVFRPDKRVLKDLVLINLATHPVATLAVWKGSDWYAVETLVIAAEALGYRVVSRLPWARAILIAGLCNVLTALIGLALS